MYKKTFVICLSLLFISTVGFAGYQEDIDNILGTAYQAVIDGNVKSSHTHFISAAKMSIKHNFDRGIIESIKGMYVVGDWESAEKYAETVIANSDSWHSVCGIGYLYASLKGNSAKANKAFLKSYKIASNKGDWYGMAESAKALHRIGKKEDALNFLETAEQVASLQKAYKKMDVIVQIYDLMGEKGKASNLRRKLAVMTSPKPMVIDTIPAKKKICKKSQRSIKNRVERDVAADDEYINEERMKKKEDQYYSSWEYYNGYFVFLRFDLEGSGYDSLVPDIVIAPAIMNTWAQDNLRHYSSSTSGTFIYIN